MIKKKEGAFVLLNSIMIAVFILINYKFYNFWTEIILNKKYTPYGKEHLTTHPNLIAAIVFSATFACLMTALFPKNKKIISFLIIEPITYYHITQIYTYRIWGLFI